MKALNTPEVQTFDLAKGILVVDPIEARGIRVPNKSAGNLYLLFQIGTKVQRSRKIPTNSTFHRWKEDSQCKFQINPGISAVLIIYLMQDSKHVPTVLGQGNLNLVDVFYEKNADRWIKLNQLGQINIEFTFYALAPLVPKKVNESPIVEQAGDPTSITEQQKASQSAKKLISAVDLVFDDNEVEESRLKKFAKTFKRHYRESVKENYDYQDVKHVRKPSIHSFILEVETTEEKRKLPPVPPKNDTEMLLSKSAVESIPSPSPIFNELSIKDLNIESFPFSANEIGGQEFKIQLEKVKQKEIKERTNLNYQSLSPEAYFFIDRLQKGMLQPGDFYIESGVSEYRGNARWTKGCLRDSVRTDGVSPKLPPKIPVGMKEEEYFATNRDDCIEYFKKNTIFIQ